eukprot:5608688-Ditylum_brightwellii.AAC.1
MRAIPIMPVAVTTVSVSANTKSSLPSCSSKAGLQLLAWWKNDSVEMISFPCKAMNRVVIKSH